MLISKRKASQMLGVSIGRVQQLIRLGKLNAKKIGSVWIVDSRSVEYRKSKLKPHTAPK